MSERIVMVASSYPRFPKATLSAASCSQSQKDRGARTRGAYGRAVASEMESPEDRSRRTLPSFSVHADSGDEHLRLCRGDASGCPPERSAVAVAPLALLAGWFKALRVAQKKRATIVHAHWVIPGGVIGAAAAGSTPLVISLHGSDVFVAERHAVARLAARAAFNRSRWVTACSEDLRAPRRRHRRRRGAIERHSLRRRQRAVQARRGRAGADGERSASPIMCRSSSPSEDSSRRKDSNT